MPFTSEYYQANREEIRAKQRGYYLHNKERLSAKHKEYYQANKEVMKECSKTYYQANKDKLLNERRGRHMEYYQANKVAINARRRELYDTNPVYKEKIKEKARKYREANREKINAKQRARIKTPYGEKHRIRAREYYHTHERYRQNHINHQKIIQKERKIIVFEKYGGKPPRCACCGEPHMEFLEIDHINGNGAQHRKTPGVGSGGQFYLWLIKNRFPGGFRVLCSNCNKARGKYGYCPHEMEMKR